MALVTSTASINLQQDETFGSDTQAPLLSSWQNEGFNQLSPLRWGRQKGKLTFDWDSVAFKFKNMAPLIPVEAKIVSAVLRGTATQAGAGDFWTVIFVHGKDGFWDDFSGVQRWRSAADNIAADADVVIYNTGVAILADTGVPGTTLKWGIRDNFFSRNLKVGQGVEIATAGTLGFIDIGMSRTVAIPAGNVWCEVYSQDGAGLADTLLATSNTRPASDVSADSASPLFRFTFSGGDRIPLTLGQDIVAVVNADYPTGFGPAVRVRWNAGGAGHGDFYPPGLFQIFGVGIGVDDNNYPMQEDFRGIPNGGSDYIAWIAPTFVAGVEYDTPDLSGPLKQYLLSGSYAPGDPFCVQMYRSNLFFPDADNIRHWAELTNATYTTPTRLIVQWRERRRGVL